MGNRGNRWTDRDFGGRRAGGRLAGLQRAGLGNVQQLALAVEEDIEGPHKLRPVDGGWKILNGAKYDSKMKQEERREYMKNYMRDYVPPAKRVASEESPPDGKPARFIKPTLEDCRAAAVKTGMPEGEGEKFFNYYEANGWRVGRNPMKNGAAAMRNWKRNYDERNGRASDSASSSDTPSFVEKPYSQMTADERKAYDTWAIRQAQG